MYNVYNMDLGVMGGQRFIGVCTSLELIAR